MFHPLKKNENGVAGDFVDLNIRFKLWWDVQAVSHLFEVTNISPGVIVEDIVVKTFQLSSLLQIIGVLSLRSGKHSGCAVTLFFSRYFF